MVPNEIPYSTLRDCESILQKPVHYLLKIIPILKSDDRPCIENLSTNSLVNNFCKAFESALCKAIYVPGKNVISQNPNGFFKGRSTITNLLQSTKFISNVLDD